MPGMRSATSCADLSGVGHQPSFLRQASDGWRKSWSHVVSGFACGTLVLFSEHDLSNQFSEK